MPLPRLRTDLGRSLLMATLAMLFYGCIAWVANAEHGREAAMRAFVAQGAASALNTFFVTMLMERLSRLSTHPPTAFALAAGGATMGAAMLTLAIHWSAGTPNFAVTVLPPIFMGSFYCVSYSAALVRFVHREAMG